jgi:hypothetical protein
MGMSRRRADTYLLSASGRNPNSGAQQLPSAVRRGASRGQQPPLPRMPGMRSYLVQSSAMEKEPETDGELPLREAIFIALTLIAGLAFLFAILIWIA